jgi:hypothetical protein
MPITMLRLMLFCLVALSLPAHAINKCAIKGKVVYTDSPCPAEAKASTIAPAPEVPEAEREAAQARLQTESQRAREAVRGADARIRRDYQSWRARRNEQIRQQQLAEIEARRRREQDAYPIWFDRPRGRYTPAPPPSSAVTKPRPPSPRPQTPLNR